MTEIRETYTAAEAIPLASIQRRIAELLGYNVQPDMGLFTLYDAGGRIVRYCASTREAAWEGVPPYGEDSDKARLATSKLRSLVLERVPFTSLFVRYRGEDKAQLIPPYSRFEASVSNVRTEDCWMGYADTEVEAEARAFCAAMEHRKREKGTR